MGAYHRAFGKVVFGRTQGDVMSTVFRSLAGHRNVSCATRVTASEVQEAFEATDPTAWQKGLVRDALMEMEPGQVVEVWAAADVAGAQVLAMAELCLPPDDDVLLITRDLLRTDVGDRSIARRC